MGRRPRGGRATGEPSGRRPAAAEDEGDEGDKREERHGSRPGIRVPVMA